MIDYKNCDYIISLKKDIVLSSFFTISSFLISSWELFEFAACLLAELAEAEKNDLL